MFEYLSGAGLRATQQVKKQGVAPVKFSYLTGAPKQASQDDEQLQNQLENYRTRAGAIGKLDTAQSALTKWNPFRLLLEGLSRSSYAGANMLKELGEGVTGKDTGDTPEKFDPFSAFWRGLSKQEETTGKDVVNALTGNQEIANKSMLGAFGEMAGIDTPDWLDKPGFFNPSAAGFLGLAVDVFNPLDPINWLSFALGGPAGGLGKQGIAKGLKKGLPMLKKAFGSSADDIVRIIGKEAASGINANTVGGVMEQAFKAGGQNPELLSLFKKGMNQAHTKASTELVKQGGRNIAVGLGNPFKLGKSITPMVEIPGTGRFITSPISKGWNKFMSTTVGDGLRRMFSTKAGAAHMPNQAVLRDFTNASFDEMKYMIQQGEALTNIPLNIEELAQLQTKLDAMQLPNNFNMPADRFGLDSITAQGYMSVNNMAATVGVDSKVMTSMINHGVPYNKGIDELFETLKGLRQLQGLPEKEIFEQAAKLRKFMDLTFDTIPPKYRNSYKGLTFGDSFAADADKMSKMDMNLVGGDSNNIQYVFNHKGVDVFLNVNSGKNFNEIMWDNLDKVTKYLDELPAENITSLKKQVQISPTPLEHLDGGKIMGYTDDTGVKMFLGDVNRNTFKHEYGHIWDSVAAKNLGLDTEFVSQSLDYGINTVSDSHLVMRYNEVKDVISSLPKNSSLREYAEHVLRSGGDTNKYISPYAASLAAEGNASGALVEDFADAMKAYLENPEAFKKIFPYRASTVELVLANSKSNPTEIINQSKRIAEEIGNVQRADDYIKQKLDVVKKKVMDSKYSAAAGDSVFGESKEEIARMLNKTSAEIQAMNDEIGKIFKGFSLKERKLITELAAVVEDGKVVARLSDDIADMVRVTDGVLELAPKYENALNSFNRFNESIVKEYHKMGIPLEAMERYVPFIPTRVLRKDQAKLASELFGTGDVLHTYGKSTDDFMTELLKKTDYSLIDRTTRAKNPREVNKLLGVDWLEEDAALLLAKRGARAIKAREMSAMFTGTAARYGIPLDDIGRAFKNGKIPEGYSVYRPKVDDVLGKKTFEPVRSLDGNLARKDVGLGEMLDRMNQTPGTGAGVADELATMSADVLDTKNLVLIPDEIARTFNEAMETMISSEKKNALLKLFDSATSSYKRIAYLYNPGHIPRDFLGNVWNNYLMGVVNPLEYVQTAKYLHNPELMIQLPKGKISAGKLKAQAEKLGIVNTGLFLSEAHGVEGLKGLGLKSGNPLKDAIVTYGDVMRNGTIATDNLTRFTAFIHELKAGKTTKEAATQVKKFTFDYFDLTPFERKFMKRIVPFYTWMRKNIPLQVEQTLKHPRDIGRMQKLMQSAEGEPIDFQRRPDQVLGGFKTGVAGRTMVPQMPYHDLATIPMNADGVRRLMSSINPLIKAPTEMATNTNMFTGRDIEQYEGETREMPFGYLMGGKAPRIPKRTVGHALDQIPILRNLDSVFDKDSHRRVQAAGSIAGSPYLADEEQVEKSMIYDEIRAIQNLFRKLKDEEGIEVPTIAEIKEMLGEEEEKPVKKKSRKPKSTKRRD